ncbi:hypothetical protein MYX04_01115 [Nitrospiraceae bacterium AH_259_D15_M11_P09]|nr:hypothetical protein [Nitrospiraceae bacterium AH_259_D15_M11_P09]
MSRKKTIAFLTIYPFNEDYARKYGFRYLRERGYRVVVLNLFHLFYGHLQKQRSHYDLLPPVCGVEQVPIKTKRALWEALNGLDGWEIVYMVLNPPFFLLRILRRARVDYIVARHAVGPIYQPEKSVTWWWEKLRDLLLSPQRILSFLKRLIAQLPPALLGYSPPRFVTALSPAGVKKRKNTQVICCHSFDYDRAQQNLDLERPGYLPSEDYLVLLANHPWGVHDAILLNLTRWISKEEYAEIINRFLDVVEEGTGKSVLIAAYPKATDDENIYCGRPFVYDTEQLVKYSSGVIGHHTGAFNFAVIHNKPVCLISLRKLMADKVFTYQNLAHSEALGASLSYIDTEEECRALVQKGLFSHHPQCYETYRRRFLVSPYADGKQVWEAIADALDGEWLRLHG